MSLSLNKLSELQKRIITAIIGACIIIGSLFWNEWSYFVVFFFICMFAQLEFYKLLDVQGNLPLRTFGTLNGLFIFTLTFLIEKYQLPTSWYFLTFVGASGVYFIKLYVRRDLKPFVNIAFTFLGILYVAVPFALLNICIFREQVYSYQLIVGVMFILWSNDTGAYFSGRTFGRRKLFYRISPKKTWEGSIGGGLTALAVSYGLSLVFHDLVLWQWLCIAVIIAITGTYGDLVESLFKRSMNIKDSGTVLPGHGGFLDRFDGLLIASPFIVAFVELAG
jgi:phosphatidate cytidylyltransferase